jgi:O-antigen ligase
MTHVVRFAWVTLVWFWLLRAVCPDRRALARLLRGVAVTVYVSSVAAIAGYLGIVHLTEYNLEGREAAFMNHYNELGGLLAAGLPLVVLGAFRLGRDGASAYGRAAAIAIVVIAINTTGSLTAFVGCASGLVAAGALNVLTLNRAVLRRFRNPLPLLLGILAALFAVVWLSTTDLPALERFEQVGQEETGPSRSADSRQEFISEVVENFDHYLVTGEGVATVVEVEGDSTHRVHNLYLRLVYEAGIPALVGFGAIVVACFRQCWLLAINTRNTELNRVVVGLFGSLISMLVLAMFQPILTQRFFWLPMGLIGVVWALRRSELRDMDLVRA